MRPSCNVPLYVMLLAVMPVLCLGQPLQLRFENLTTAQGLSSNNITCFYQDKDGFLWVGTNYGLNRYDGRFFKTFYHEATDSNSISGNQVADILQDRQGIFWIATKDGGLTKYDARQPETKRFKQYTLHPKDDASIATNRLNCLYDYNDDYLLIGAEVYPVIFLNKKTGKFSYWNDNRDLFGPKYASAKKESTGKQNWAHRIKRGPDNSLLISFLFPQHVTTVVNDSVYNEAPGFIISAKKKNGPNEETSPLSIPDFCVDGDTLWCASWAKGLFYQTLPLEGSATQSVIRSFSCVKNEVNHVEIFNPGWLLVSTKNEGVLLVDKRTGRCLPFVHNVFEPSSIISNNVTAIFKDRQGTWWIGTKEGISKYNPGLWQFSTLHVANEAQHNFTNYSIYEDEEQTLRLCTNDGLYKKRSGENLFKLIPLTYKGKKLSPSFIHAYEQGKFALGTETGLFKYDPVNEQVSPFICGARAANDKRPFLPALSDFQMYQVRDIITDTINGHPTLCWAALGWGMGIYDLSTHFFDDFLRIDTLPESIRNNLSRRIIKDKKGTTWVATAEGLYRWEKSSALQNKFTAYVHTPGDAGSISNNDINDIYTDNQNHLWLATNGGGICEFDGRKFYTYRSPLQAANVIYGIYADRRNRLWVASAAGFEIFDPVTKSFHHVEVPDAEWKLQPPSRLLVRKDGSFAYVANNLLITFHPDAIEVKDVFPHVLLTNFQLHHQSLQTAFAQNSYAHNENFFSFYFSAPQLQLASMRMYVYKLEGFDESWSAPINEGKAEYPNLPPGNYIFKAKVSDGSGQWGNEISLISFTINQPFWQQWWFYILAAVILVLFVYTLINSRIKQLLRIQNIRNNIANDLHDDVGSALSTISLYSEVAKIKADSKTDLKEVLDKITATSQEMQENMSHIVWSLQPRNDKFDQIILRMKNYVNEVLGAKNIEVKFEADHHLDNILLTSQQRKEFFLIFKEAINNISKYAQCKSVNVFLTYTKKNMEMQITDNGKGFNTVQKYSGNGMHSMKQRAKALSGKLTMQSSPETGTRVHLKFPV